MEVYASAPPFHRPAPRRVISGLYAAGRTPPHYSGHEGRAPLATYMLVWTILWTWRLTTASQLHEDECERGEGAVLKSCPYCGMIHSAGFICPKKPERVNGRARRITSGRVGPGSASASRS